MKFGPDALTLACMNCSGPSGVSFGGKLASGVPPYSPYSRASAEVKPAL